MQRFQRNIKLALSSSIAICFLLVACSVNAPTNPQGNHQVLLDENENGIKDASDAALIGVSVVALDANGNEIERALTNSRGFVSLSLEALSAQLIVEPSETITRSGDTLSCESANGYSLCSVERLADTRDTVRLDEIGLELLEEGNFFLTSVATGFCAGVEDASQDTGANVAQFTCYDNFTNQQWQFSEVGALFSLTAAHSGQVMEVAGASQAEEANVQQGTFASASNQLWDFQEVTPTTYRVVASHSNKCLQVRFNTTVNGINLEQATCDGSDTQLFQVALVNDPTTTFPFLPDPDPSTVCRGLTQEGEDGTFFGFYESKAQASASGGAFARTPDGDEPPFLIDNLRRPVIENRVEYCVNITQSGIYQIKTWVSGLDDSDDSYWVRIDTGTPFQYLYGDITNGIGSPNPFPEFTTDFVSDRQGNNPFTIELEAGDHYLSLLMRETGANLDKFEFQLLEATNPQEPTCAGLVQEAEFGVLSGNFSVQNSGSASGGQFIEAPQGTGFISSAPSNNTATYCFNILNAGEYRLQGTVLANDPGNDSFFVNLSNQNDIYLWDVTRSTSFSDDFLSDRGGPDPVTFDLTPGQYIVTVYQREDGTQLDKLELDQIGGGIEPTCAGLVQEAEFGVLTGGFVALNDALASGGQYIEAPNGAGFETSAPNLSSATYCFNIPASGTYFLKADVLAENAGADSFFVNLDSQADIYLWDVTRNASYTSDFLSNRGGPDPVSFTLPPGQVILTVYQREDGTRLDTVELTTSFP